MDPEAASSQPETSPYGRAIRELMALGYHALPLMPPGEDYGGAGKAPGDYRGGRWWGMKDWQRFRDRAPSDFERGLWSRNWPAANVGVVLGSPANSSTHVIALDIDVENLDAIETLVSAAPYSPMVKRGAKGRTLFYRAAKTIKTRSYDDSRNGARRRIADLLTGFDTRQTVCPPSVHPTGSIYTWLAGPVAAQDLPLFDDDALERLEDTLRTLGWDPDARSNPVHKNAFSAQYNQAAQADEDDYWSETKTAALANLQAWALALDLYNCRPARGGFEAVATWRPSSTGKPLEQRKRNLSIQANGIKDFGTNQTYSAIDLVMAAQGVDQAEATSWLRQRLGLDAGDVVVDLQPRSPAAPLSTPAQTPDELPDALTRVPGVLGDLVNWIADSARRPQRGLALGAALAIVGTAAGRKYAGPTRTGTHLYVLGLARTSAGKDHALNAIARVLGSVGMGQHVGPSQFMSLSALVKRVSRHPLTLCPMDEFGSFLARINNRRASPHERAITGMMRTCWGASFQTVSPPEWSAQTADPIHAPALSVYGVSTPEEFYEALAGGDVHNGFLNRFLLLSTKKRPAERDPKVDPFTVPESIRAALHRIYGSGSALAMATSHMGQADGPLITATWDDPAAHAVYTDFGRAMEDREADMAFLARTVEMAQRLAAVRAIGIRPDAPRITVPDMQWGRDVALWSAERMIAETSDYMADTPHQAEAQRVVRIVKERRRVLHGDLVRAMQHRMKAADLKAVISGLVEAGQIVQEIERDPTRPGPDARYYRLP